MARPIRVRQDYMDWLNSSGQPLWAQELLLGVPEGMRYSSAIRLAGWLYGRGFSAEEVAELLVLWNSLNMPPMDEEEIVSIIRSTRRWECTQMHNAPPMTYKEARDLVTEVKRQIRKRRLSDD